VTVTTVFRERVRGRTDDRGIRTGDRIDVPPAVHVAALLEEVAARRSVGDLAGARTVAAAAATRAQEASVSADVRRRALAELGTIEHALGARDESARHLRAAVDELDAAPPASPAERAEILNELGTVEIEQRDYAAADRSLQAAQTLADGATRIRVMNNLGAVASLRGNRDAAVALYRQAQSLAAGAADLAAERAAIGKNLDALARAR
jgi:tetratricopeptide (TPR) repeat protein